MLATVNPRNNLAHCFGCNKNLNNIDLLLTMGYDFKSAVSILTRMYEQHCSRMPPPDQHRRTAPLQFAQQFGNRASGDPKSIQPLFGKKCDYNSADHT
jgi:DNA primase